MSAVLGFLVEILRNVTRPPLPFLAGAVAVLAILFAVTTPASSYVMEVENNGSLAVYDAPSVFRTEGVDQIGIFAQGRQPGQSTAAPPGGGIGDIIFRASERYAVNAELLQALAWRESRFNHEAVSSKGAVGIMQLMADTARELGVDRYDLSQNILGGAAYLRKMLDRYGGDESLALAAYNAGPAAVDHYGGVPPFPETRNYVAAVFRKIDRPLRTRPPFVISIDP